jgi:hypothetical protein
MIITERDSGSLHPSQMKAVFYDISIFFDVGDERWRNNANYRLMFC